MWTPPTPRESRSGPVTPTEASGTMYLLKLSLLAAKNLQAANISGTSDPYAVITCGAEKRFSSVVPGSRNPMWGEEFYFQLDELPVSISILIYDWDIIWKSQGLGATALTIDEEGDTGADWYPLDKPGQVCLQIVTQSVPRGAEGFLGGGSGPLTRRRRFSQQLEPQVAVATEVRQKPGLLQTVFDLPPDEVILYTFSCALERSFLYHGRMYISAWHICFQSNIFGKQIRVIIPFEDIDEMRKSVHAFINPAITVILRSGIGGYGVPPLVSRDGRAKYKFASFWNRGYTLRTLRRSLANFFNMEEASAQEEQHVVMRARSIRQEASADSADDEGHDSDDDEYVRSPLLQLPVELQKFLNHDVLNSMIDNVELPCTAEEYLSIILADDSQFIHNYRGARKDVELTFDKWNEAEQYGGQVREINFRSLCNSPMCPPTTRMTEWQHYHVSPDKSILTFEVIQQAHDVPFGSYFEVQAQWTMATVSSSSCTASLKMGVHFKKWCVMQGKIRGGAANEYKADATRYLDFAKKEVEAWREKQNGEASTSGTPLASPSAPHVESPLTLDEAWQNITSNT
eukprot:jgi/Mesen1/4283/ME000022S03574